MELKHLIIGLAIAFISYVVVEQRRSKKGIQEPPCHPAKIPLVGHIIGFARDGLGYFGKAWYVDGITYWPYGRIELTTI
jgi:hypothetical protein